MSTTEFSLIPREQFLANVKEYIQNNDGGVIDGRDLARLTGFLTCDEIVESGIVDSKDQLNQDFVPLEWTMENVMERISKDVEFAFEKALDKRGISSSLMSGVLVMWTRILGIEHILDEVDYPMYGLPIVKAVANYFGFKDEIPDFTGSEEHFNG